MGFIIFIIFVAIILAIIIKLMKQIKVVYVNENNTNNNVIVYSKKPFITDCERYFYNILVQLESELNVKIIPQVNLASVINKTRTNSSRYNTELFRNIDFGIFTKDFSELLLLIEINDSTHKIASRKSRDIKVDKIVKSANIRLIKFYTEYPNKPEYVKNRVMEELKNILK